MNKSLRSYRQKRNFSKTPEPMDGEHHTRNEMLRFVIHKHDASQLHYDFRLQVGNAMASWVLPKGPSTKAGEKRLAIRVEDHPVDYADFEGVIPEDEYGGGTVMIWDRGKFQPLKDEKSTEKEIEQAIEKGTFKFELFGKKLEGGYALTRLNKKNQSDHWLFFKLDDDKADGRRNPVSTEPDSVKTGRSMQEIRQQETE